MRKGIAKEKITLKACNDMIFMIIIGELLSMTVFPPYRSGIYMTILTSRRMMMKKLIILVIKTAIQRIYHPVQDNLASRAAPLSR